MAGKGWASPPWMPSQNPEDWQPAFISSGNGFLGGLKATSWTKGPVLRVPSRGPVSIMRFYILIDWFFFGGSLPCETLLRETKVKVLVLMVVCSNRAGLRAEEARGIGSNNNKWLFISGDKTETTRKPATMLLPQVIMPSFQSSWICLEV